MTFENIGLVFGGHFLGGVTLALTDRYFSENARRKTEDRVARKVMQAEALEYLAKADSETDSGDYLKNVLIARDYFRSCGKNMTIKSIPLSERATETLNGLRLYERVNNLSARMQLGFAFSAELAVDATVAASSLIAGVGNVATALLYTPLEGIALFAGLQAGKGFLNVKSYFRKSKDESEINEILQQLTRDGKLLQVVRNYSPTVNVKTTEVPEVLETSEGKNLTATEIGAKVGETVGTAIDSVRTGFDSALTNFKARVTRETEARKTAKELATAKRMKPFNDLLRKYGPK